jgi:hypothetical protein
MPDPEPHTTAPHFTASPTLSFCVLEGTVIVLDIEADRYLALGPRRGAKVLANLAGKDELDRLPVGGIALTGDPLAGAIYVLRQRPMLPVRNHLQESPPGGTVRIVDAWRAAWLQIAAFVRLKTFGFDRTLHWATKPGTARDPAAKGNFAVKDAVIRAHRWARSSLPFKDACLPASLALARALTRAGTAYALVVGVKLNPFAAHCWVEEEGTVLNDDLETVRSFTPIRVVRG